MLSSMKKSIGWFVFTMGAFCFFQGNLNSKMRHKLNVLVKEEALDVKTSTDTSANYEQCEHQTRNIKLRCRLRAGGRGCNPGNSWWGVPPGSPNPDPISNAKNVFLYTRF